MEPDLITEPRLQGILRELQALEPLFHRPEKASTMEEFERMIAPSFWEIGASGRRYSRMYVLKVLEERLVHPSEEQWDTQDFHCLELGAGNYLLTYTLKQKQRVTRRASLWRKNGADWQIVFHQGTIVENL